MAGPRGFRESRTHKEKSVANLNREQLRRLTRLGAIARLAELREEEASIRAEFPDLFGRVQRATGTSPASGPAAGTRKRRRRSMTAAARKAVSERMQKYWAERRKTKVGKAGKVAKAGK
jgi:hypothetical protein